jgi:succinyl-CoA synthetase beta subunit
MKLLEYEAKEILRDCQVVIPNGGVANAVDELSLPRVLKVQVPVGGRGKAGGVVVVRTQYEYQAAFETLPYVIVGGFTPSCIYAEELLEVDRELYVSLIINRESSQIEIVAHPEGGVDIEGHAVNSFYREAIDSNSINGIGQAVADHLDINPKSFIFTDMLEKLYDCFVKNDATLLEINPLVLTKSGELVAADCKIELDDAASFRHPDWNFEAKTRSANFVTLDNDGTVATIANGAGLAMATVDAAKDAGLEPANFLDIGGGANEANVTKAFEEIMHYPNVRAIIINIFAGITKCDEVARAVIAARKNIENLPPLFIRLDGTNYEQAVELLEAEQIAVLETLAQCVAAAKEAVEV